MRDKAQYKRRRDNSPKRRTNSVLDLVNNFTEQGFKDLPVVPEEIEYDVQDFKRDFIKDFNALRAAVIAKDIKAVKAMGFETFCRQYKNCLVNRCDDNHYSVLYHALWRDEAQVLSGDNRLNIDMLNMLMSIPVSKLEHKLYMNLYNPHISIKAKYQSDTGLIHVEGLKDIAIGNDVRAYHISYDINAEGRILNYLKEPSPEVRIRQYGDVCTIS